MNDITTLASDLRREAQITKNADLPTFGEWAAYIRMLSKMLGEAADEIDRLRAGIRKWASECSMCGGTGTLEDCGHACPNCDDLRALLEDPKP